MASPALPLRLLMMAAVSTFTGLSASAGTVSLGSNAWYLSSTSNGTAASLSGSGTSTVTFTPAATGDNSMIWTYFTSQSLVNVGDTIQLNFTISESSTTNTSEVLRLGLFNSGGSQTTTASALSSSAFNAYTGDSAWMGLNGTSQATNYEYRSGTNTSLWASAAYTAANVSGTGADANLTANTSYNGVLTLTKVAGGVQISLSLGGITGTGLDTSVSAGTYDTLSLFSLPNSGAFTLSNMSVTYSAAPEPGPVVLLGVGLLFVSLSRWRLRRA